MDRKQILALMKAAIETPVSSNYSFNGEQLSHFALNETLRRELKALSDENFGNHQAAFRLIEEAVTDILPKRIENAYGRFAEIKTVPQSTTAIFTRKLGRIRAKQFVTRVGLAGLYEVGRLGDFGILGTGTADSARRNRCARAVCVFHIGRNRPRAVPNPTRRVFEPRNTRVSRQ